MIFSKKYFFIFFGLIFIKFNAHSQDNVAKNAIGKLKKSIDKNESIKNQLSIAGEGLKSVETKLKENKNNVELWEIQAYLSAFIAVTDKEEANIEINYKRSVQSIDSIKKIKGDKYQSNLLTITKHNINIQKQNKANKAIENREFTTAFVFLKDLSDEKPQDTTLAINTAFCAGKQQNYPEELTYLIRSVNNGAKNPVLFKKIATIYLSNFETENALQYFEMGLKLNPLNQYLINDYVNLLLEKQKYTQAVDVLENYIQHQHNNKLLLYLYGNLMHNYIKDFEKAEHNYKLALELDPNDFEIYYQLGLLYIEQKKLNKAEIFLLKALEINPKDLNTIKLLIEIYTKTQKTEKAILFNKKLNNL